MPSSWVKPFQFTAARRRLRRLPDGVGALITVSIHSRPKAAAKLHDMGVKMTRFNSQPPEGGCARSNPLSCESSVSIHSRPKAAAPAPLYSALSPYGFNSQPPEGGCSQAVAQRRWPARFQFTAARRRLRRRPLTSTTPAWFQFTAARRRLLQFHHA